MKEVTSSLTGDDLDLRPVPLTAEQATQLRHYASRHSRVMPISQRERDQYAAQGIEPPQR